MTTDDIQVFFRMIVSDFKEAVAHRLTTEVGGPFVEGRLALIPTCFDERWHVSDHDDMAMVSERCCDVRSDGPRPLRPGGSKRPIVPPGHLQRDQRSLGSH